MHFSLPGIAATIVGAFFLVPGLIELAMWRRFVDRFVEWGYPAYWPTVTYTLKIAGGVMVFMPTLRVIGLVLCAGISFAALATIVLRKVTTEYKAIPVNILALGLIGVAFVQGH